MKCEAPRAPRSSPAHLVYKFGGAVQEILNLATQLDAKTLSDKQTARLRERIHDLDSALWPDDPHGATKATDAQNDAALADATGVTGSSSSRLLPVLLPFFTSVT